MSFWNSTLIKSGRRDHRCESCGRAIPVGDPSYRECGLAEGDFRSYRLCLPCRAFIERQFECGALERGETFMLDWLPDIARDAGEPWPPSPIQEDAGTPNKLPATNDEQP